MMKFFLPFSFRDYITQEWDRYTEENRGDTKLFCWNVFKDPPMDGILVSRPAIEQKLNANGQNLVKIHELLKLKSISKKLEVFGDCGAFSYIDDPEPWYDPLDQLEFYSKLEFDLGATVDHAIVPAVLNQKQHRFDITLQNAKIMFNEWEKRYQNFQLIGVAQGWNVTSILQSLKSLIEIGFSYIAIGGVARKSKVKPLDKILYKTRDLLKDLKEKPKIHIFGVGQENLFPIYKTCGVHSFDHSGMLRNSWQRDEGYYLDQKKFATIRIPLKISQADSILNKIRLYSKGQYSFREVQDTLSELEKEILKLGRLSKTSSKKKRKSYLEFYKKTLLQQPWKTCPCELCKETEVDIVIFRSGERNIRRGFHNVYNFYRNFKSRF